MKGFKRQFEVILRKDLPNCPKGRIFKEDSDGDFYHSMSDQEVIEGSLKEYTFTRDEIISNRKWFKFIFENV